jgi:hypothetical protein
MVKKQKLHHDKVEDLMSLGRASYASKSAIAGLCAHIRKHGVPDASDRRAQFRARKHMCQTATPYGNMVVELPVAFTDGRSAKLGFQNPLAFFHHHCSGSSHYAKIVSGAMRRSPCSPASPWNIIMYQDGVDPSDGLAKNHSRKSVVFYWSFAEFGMHALAHEEVWGTLCVMRSTQVKALHGQVVQLFEHTLSLFFGATHDIRLSGVSVDVKHGERAERATIFASVGVLLADEPALKELLHCKGHAGIKPCCLCMDATHHNTGGTPLHVLTDKAVSITDTNLGAFTKHSDESIRSLVQRVDQHHDNFVARMMTKEQFEDRMTILGWNWAPSNPILNDKYGLKIASSVMFDWAHVYVHDGLADVELGQCMKAFHSSRSSTTFKELGEYVGTFTFPKRSPNPRHLFSPSANANNAKKGSFTCTGSEFLTLAPVLHRYFDRVVRGRGQLMANVDSMVACLAVVLLLVSVKTGLVSASVLFSAISVHLPLYKACYGDGCVRPKHHYALHLPDMLQRFGFLLATFTHERKHRLVTRYTRDRKNLSSWDLGAIEDITCHQMWELKQEFFMAMKTSFPRGRSLYALREIFPGVDDAAFTLISGTSCNGGQVCTGDIVSCLVDGAVQLGELLLTVGVKGSGTHSIISLWQVDGAIEPAQAWVKFKVSDEHVVKVNTEDSVDTVYTHRMADDRRSCAVYLPPEVRAVKRAAS